MNLEAAIQENTAAVRELTAAVLSMTVQAGAVRSSPLVQAVERVQLEAEAKKPATETTANAKPVASAPSGEPSAPTREKSSAGTMSNLQPWAEITADAYASLKDAEPKVDSLKQAVLQINSKIGRPQAEAVLARFGAQAVTPKADRRALDPGQYADFFALCLEVLAGRVDATQAISEAA